MTASYRRKRKEQAQAKAHRQEEENLKWEDEFLELQAELFRHRNRKIVRSAFLSHARVGSKFFLTNCIGKANRHSSSHS